MINHNKFTPDANKPFHSSGYAEVAHGNSIGSTSSQSFRQRYRIDRNRKHVQRYRSSHVATGSMLRQELSRKPDGSTTPPQTKPVADRQSFNASGADASRKPAATSPRQQFTEPPKRGFNPYD